MSESIVSRSRAIGHLLALARPLKEVPISPSEAIGLAPSKDISTSCEAPEQPCSVRDGYALQFADIEKSGATTPVCLTVTQSVHAESSTPAPVVPGESARVLTGGLIPPGADTVLAEEDVELDGRTIIIRKPARKGWYVRQAGDEISLGAVITEAGVPITPQAAAVMVRTRVETISVHPKPEARVLALGSELSDPISCGPDCDTARFPADNLVLAKGLLEQSGVHVIETGVLPDNEETLVQLLSHDELPDIIITTGGTGRSERDFARSGAERSGFTTIFDNVDIRPGRHTFAAHRDGVLLFGFPGPPAAVFACFHALILPVIRRLRGLPDLEKPVMARFEKGLSARHGSEWLVQCELKFKGSSIMATPLTGRDIPSMLGMGKAHGVAVLQSGDSINPDDEVEILSTMFWP